MSESYFEFKALETPSAVQNMRQLFMSGAYADGVFQKNFSQQFVSDLYFYLESPNNSVKTKFNSLSILKDVIAKGDVKIVGLLSSSPQFLQLLQTSALKIDPKKPLSQKGKSTFPDDKQKYGNRYITLILQMIVYLGKKYSRTGKQEPTRFRKVLMKLQSENVTLPQQFTFFPKLKDKEDSTDIRRQANKQSALNRKEEGGGTKVQERQRQKKGGTGFESLVRFVKSKIQIYMGSLQDAQQIEEMQKIIMSTHQIFGGELKKFDELGDSIYDPLPNKTQKQNSELIQQYLKVRAFLQEQIKLYSKNITKNEFSSYYNEIKLKYEQIFPETGTKRTPGSGTSKMEPKNTKDLKKTDSIVSPNIIPKQNYGSKNSDSDYRRGLQDNIMKKQASNYDKPDDRAGQRRITTSGAGNNLGSVMSNLFDRLQSRSKSPHSGFSQLRESVQKEKNSIQAHPASRHRQTKVNKPIQIQSSNLSRSGLKPVDIFYNPPNLNPPSKTYEGQYLQTNKQLENILYDIKKEQGSGRFKKSNFKNKGLLFENETIEIGYKSEAIFEQYDGFSVFLSLQLYLGNKSEHQIKHLQISFEGDQNCLVYTSPQQIVSNIDSQNQVKHQIMFIPTKVPFVFTNMRLSYKCGQFTTRTTIALPTSILKLSSNIQLTKSQFINYWQSATEIYKSDSFRLSRHLPPNMLRKYIANLCQLNSYSDFSISGSVKDYELYTLIDIYNTYEVLLKINVRPNMNVVVQVAATDPSEDGSKLMKFYLESLQILLQQTNG